MTLKSRAGRSGKIDKAKKGNKKLTSSGVADKESVQLVAQEIKFARSLAGNDKRSRDRVLKTLRRWLMIRTDQDYEFKEEDFLRIWKGLFYAMWMSDKPLIQEELSESIAGLLDVFPAGRSRAAALFFKCGLRSLATEWYGLDQHRMDKFLMLVRRLLRAAFRCIRREDWSDEACAHLTEALGGDDCVFAPKPPQYARNALALMIHIVECFVEELAKVSEGSIPDEALVELTRPLARCMALCTDSRLSGCIKRHLFVQLLQQTPAHSEYEEKKQAWTQMGCPEGGVDCMEPASDDEEVEQSDDEGSNSESALDPRAGRVNVILQPLPVPANLLVAMLRPLAVEQRSQTDNRRRVRVLIQHLEELDAGQYPLRVREDVMAAAAAVRRGAPRPARAARRLHEFEKKVIAQSDELALRGLSRKHRKRILAKTRERLAAGDEAEQSPGNKNKRRRRDSANTSGEWKVEDTTRTNDKTKESGKKSKNNKRKMPTTLVDEVPLKKLKNLLKEKESNEIIDDKNTDVASNKIVEKSKLVDESKKVGGKHVDKSKKVVEKSKPVDESKKDESKAGDKSKTVKKSSTVNKSRAIEKTSAVKSKKLHDRKAKKLEAKKLEVKSEEKTKQASAKIVAKKLAPSSSKIAASEKKVFEKKTDKNLKSKLRGKSVEKTTAAEKTNSDVAKKMMPKKVTIVLKNNTAQGFVDYYKSVKQSPSIPFDSAKKPTKTNLKPNSTPSPINPFFKKKLRLRM